LQKAAVEKENRPNPYSEYKKIAATGAAAQLVQVDDAQVRAKVADLRAESELLRK